MKVAKFIIGDNWYLQMGSVTVHFHIPIVAHASSIKNLLEISLQNCNSVFWGIGNQEELFVEL